MIEDTGSSVDLTTETDPDPPSDGDTDTGENAAADTTAEMPTDTEVSTAADTRSERDTGHERGTGTEALEETDTPEATDTAVATDADTDTMDEGTGAEPRDASDSAASGDFPDDSTPEEPCGLMPCVTSVQVADRATAEIAEGHTGRLYIHGFNLASTESVTVDGIMACQLTDVPLNELVQCIVTVPHGAAEYAANQQQQARPVAVTVAAGGQLTSDGGAYLRISPIVVAETGDNTGDGTTAAPYRTITHALGTSGIGDTLLVDEGTYLTGETFPLTIPPGVTVRGVGEVSVIVSSSEVDAVAPGVGGPSADHPTRLENLSLTGGRNGWLVTDGHAELVEVTLSGSGSFGIQAATTAHLYLEGVVIIGFGIPPGYDYLPGAAIFATDDSVVEGDGVIITAPNEWGWGVFADDRARLVFNGLEIEERYRYDGFSGAEFIEVGGLWSIFSSSVTLTNSHISHCLYGVLIWHETKFNAADTFMEDNYYSGLSVDATISPENRTTLEGVSISNNGAHGAVFVRTNLVMSDTTVSNNRGAGMIVSVRSDLQPLETPMIVNIDNTSFESNLDQGIWIIDTYSAVTLDSVDLLGNLARAPGLLADTAAQLELHPDFEGRVRATNTTFSFDDENAYSPPLGTVSGPAGYLDPAAGRYHYWVAHEAAAVEFY